MTTFILLMCQIVAATNNFVDMFAGKTLGVKHQDTYLLVGKIVTPFTEISLLFTDDLYVYLIFPFDLPNFLIAIITIIIIELFVCNWSV